MTAKKATVLFLLPVLLSLFLHLHVFKLELRGYHVWRQAQTQTVIYNFCFSDNNILHPQKFDLTHGSTALLYEFPLYQWLVAQVDRAFGYSVMHARMGSFVIFTLFLLGFFRLLRNFFSIEIALITNVLLCFSPMLYYYCVCPLPDILALCLSVWSLVFFFRFLSRESGLGFLAYALCLSLAALVKLPYILFGGSFVYYVYRCIAEKKYTFFLQALCLLVLMIPVLAWYVHAIPTWGYNPVTKGVLDTDKEFLYLLDCFVFHLVSTVPEVIANYASVIFLLTGMYLFFKKRKELNSVHRYFIVVFVLFAAYFLFELSAIEKVHDYYLMPFIPLIFLVIAYGVNFLYQGKYRKLVLLCMLLTPLTAWLRMGHRWSGEPTGALKDYIYNQPLMQKTLLPNELCIVDHDNSRFVSLYYLKRRGYSLSENHMSPQKLKELYEKGARYLVSENNKTYSEEFKDFDVELLYHENIRIYKLKLK